MMGENVLILVRWMHFTAEIMLFGGASFPLLILSPNAPDGPEHQQLVQRIAQMVRWMAAFVVITAIFWLLISIDQVSGSPTGMMDWSIWQGFLFQTSFGPAWMVRIVAGAAIVLASPWPVSRLWFGIMSVLGGIMLVAQAWLGHAAGVDKALIIIALLAYVGHVLAAGIWIGGLPPLYLGLRSASLPRQGNRPLAINVILARFSAVGIASVGILAMTGMINSWLHINSWSHLAGTIYGKLVIAKIGLFTVLLGIALYNFLYLTPKMNLAHPERAYSTFLKTIAVELMVGLLALLAAAALGIHSPFT